MKVKIFRPLRLTAVWLAIWLTALLCFPVSAASPRLAGDLNGDGRMELIVGWRVSMDRL